MASGFFAVLDDIAVLLDDVAMMSKIAAKKTAGILGDDLAVNAEKASGFASKREIPVLWAITKGSLLNKLIILPFAFLLSAFLPSALSIILIIGGVYLAFEGVEKIYEVLVPHPAEEKAEILEVETEEEILALEKTRVRSAIVTDFILSVEIIIIAMSTVVNEPLMEQILVVSSIAILATVGVYGIVALIVRMDEAGFHLIKKSKSDTSFKRKLGNFLVNALPFVIKGLSIVGTLALLLVSGGIFSHNIDFFHHLLESWPPTIKDFILGLVIGAIAVFLFQIGKKVFSKNKH
jgi:predicted DNA repair protein MutK